VTLLWLDLHSSRYIPRSGFVKSGRRQGCPLFPLLFNIILEFLTRAIRQEEEIKEMQIRKEEVKWSLFAGDTILYLKDQRNATIKFLDIINTFSNVTGYKNQFKKSIAFLYTKDEQTEKEYRNTIPFTLDSKI
jgi:hypothetical protein